MKTLLICPGYADIYSSYRHLYKRGFLNPPIGLCYLAASLLEAGHDVKIVDGEAQNLSLQEIVREIEDYSPQLIGITATSVDIDRGEEIAQAIKDMWPELPILIGGTHVNIYRKEVLQNCDSFDLACVGDGEDLIVEVVDQLKSDTAGGLKNIKGLIYREENSIIENELRKVEPKVARYPSPARHLLQNELYYRAVPYKGYQTTAAVMSSRGCPYKCNFCAVKKIFGGAQVRVRPASDVVDEIEHIVRDMGISHIAFNDDCLTIRRSRMMEICQEIQDRGLEFTWEGLSRADLLDEEMLRAMKAVGFVRISIGIESGNPDVLKSVGKGETLEQIEHGITLCHKVGIVTRGSVIIGHPFETRQTIRDTFNFINRLRGLDQVVINILQPYPGTKVRDMVLKGEGGIEFVGDSNSLSGLQRFGNAQIKVNGLFPKKLIFLQKYGFLRFYLRPRVILNNLRISGYKTFFIDSVGFVRSILGI